MEANSLIALNVVSYDYYLSNLLELYDSTQVGVKKVPVIRIFGNTPNGQQGCVHVHGYFPYFFIRPEKYDDLSFQTSHQIDK